MRAVLRNGCMSRRPAPCVTASSKTPLSCQDWGLSQLHSLLLELSKTCIRKVPNPQTMNIVQGPASRKVLGTVVNTSLEDQIARKGLWAPERVLRAQKMKHDPVSQPRGTKAGVDLRYSGGCCSSRNSRSDLRSERMRGLDRTLTFQGSTPGSVLKRPPAFAPLHVGEILQCMLIKMYFYVLC